MVLSWTEEQKQVIQLRDRNLLVSAAAGSGKTAVLVERIVQRVLDRQRPADIDRMLVVTFTKAAAAEMRERIGQAIEKRMEEEPDNSRLQRQYTLVHNAQITTIDSFCLYVVRNYFQTVGLEPSFRIADPGELQLLKADVAQEVMERHYQEKSEGFLRLADRYATAKSDSALVDFMLRIYDFSQSYPWPDEWLASLAGHYQVGSVGQMQGQGSVESQEFAQNPEGRRTAGSQELQGGQGTAGSQELQGGQGTMEGREYAEGQGIAGSQEFAESQGIAEDQGRIESREYAESHGMAEGQKWLESQEWMGKLLQYLGNMAEGLKRQMEYAATLCRETDGPGMYLAAVQDDIVLLEGLCQCGSYAEYGQQLSALQFTKLGVNRKYTGSKEKQEQVKELRKTMKDTLGKIQDTYFYQDSAQMLRDIGSILPDVEALVELAQSFAKAYQDRKQERNLLDFSDIEHYALKILVDEKTKEPTAAARELREAYEEIMIDEYQDSNYVQETILKAVSREEDGQNNIFMVGDVKQSIYRFRLARPELFIEKYKAYTKEESDKQKIDLHQNFRSRKEVVESINRIFFQIMHEDLGNVEYDSQAALYAGASYYPSPELGDMLKQQVMSKQQDMPNLQDMPDLQDIPNLQDMPKQQDMLNLQDMPKQQDMPDQQGMPNLQDMPNQQDMPNLQDMPKQQDMPKGGQGNLFQSELLLAQASQEELAAAGMDDWQELEARMVAARIQELLQMQLVTDKESGGLRPVRYRDIVILLRSMAGWADTFSKVLAEAGIPSHTASQTGYFSTVEIQTVLSMLSILDNPLQDIPLAAVLMSPIGGMDGEELAKIRACSKEHFYYFALEEYAQYGGGKYTNGGQEPGNRQDLGNRQEPGNRQNLGSGQDIGSVGALDHLVKKDAANCPVQKDVANSSVQKEADAASGQGRLSQADRMLYRKAARFLRLYKRLRSLTPYTPIHKLIQIVLQETGYASYIQAMPTGGQRRANVDMLLEKAVAYEKTSYKGLFHFVRYIEKLKKYEVDFGEADITGENDNVVRIMSIHKSKGLEFPVVFACGMGKQFNRQDTRSRLVLHPEHGIGLDYIDADRRIRKPGFIKKVLENEIGIENQGEELRVLYVALTRTKEKLIMSGAVKEELQPAESMARREGQAMDYLARYRASCYLDWIYPCMANGQELYRLRVYHPQDLQAQAAVEAAAARLSKRQVQDLYKIADKKLYVELDKKLSWNYPFASDTGLKTKISVSELKHRRDAVPEEDALPAQEWFPASEESIVPAFMRTEAETEGKGALRGSAVHKVMEEVDFIKSMESSDRMADIREQIGHMLAEQHITQEMQELVSPWMIGRFLSSPLAGRMAKAQQRGQLHREQPFVMGIPASRVYEGASEELVLIQGIVDVYWAEDGELVILDYKTDSVKEPGKLVQRYETQLRLYGEALEKATGKRVKEKIIYSFALQEAITVN